MIASLLLGLFCVQSADEVKKELVSYLTSECRDIITAEQAETLADGISSRLVKAKPSQRSQLIKDCKQYLKDRLVDNQPIFTPSDRGLEYLRPRVFSKPGVWNALLYRTYSLTEWLVDDPFGGPTDADLIRKQIGELRTELTQVLTTTTICDQAAAEAAGKHFEDQLSFGLGNPYMSGLRRPLTNDELGALHAKLAKAISDKPSPVQLAITLVNLVAEFTEAPFVSNREYAKVATAESEDIQALWEECKTSVKMSEKDLREFMEKHGTKPKALPPREPEKTDKKQPEPGGEPTRGTSNNGPASATSLKGPSPIGLAVLGAMIVLAILLVLWALSRRA